MKEDGAKGGQGPKKEGGDEKQREESWHEQHDDKGDEEKDGRGARMELASKKHMIEKDRGYIFPYFRHLRWIGGIWKHSGAARFRKEDPC